jgi:CDP-glucose 4,6-dehydratase
VSFWRGRRVLVTGHTGFKGSWLSLWLRELGAELTGYSLAPPSTPNLFELIHLKEQIDSIDGDVRDTDHLRRVISQRRPEIIFHLAAQSLVRASYADPLKTFSTNVLGTASVLEAARAASSVRAAVIVTSDKCYDNRESSAPYSETDALGGRDPYSASKACAELVTSAYRASFLSAHHGAMRVASARAGNVIGGGDWADNRLVPDLIRAFLSGQTATIRNPSATRPWQFVLEPIRGYLLLAERLCTDEGPSFAEAWNFGPNDDDIRDVAWVANRMCALWGRATWHTDTREHPHEAFTLRLDSSKAKQRLEWSPILDLETALAWAMRWYHGYAENPAECAELTRRDLAEYENLVNATAPLPLL